MPKDTRRQEDEWLFLHDRITQTLDNFGRKNAFRKGDYWLVDDNWGWRRHQLEVQNLNLLKPHVIKSLQILLDGFPDWSMSVRVDVPGKEDIWPGMGLIIYPDQIIDELERQYLPAEFADIRFGGSEDLS
jgi:hypothetical protein